jgi:hypothetical protein
MLYNSAMFKIYYTDPVTDWSHAHNADTLKEALQYTESFRKLGMTFVAMVSEHPDSVGKPGVDSVVDGKTPDGVAYTWNKESRIGQTRK